ncbi:MAG: hypothetical protein LBU76_00570 [Azoarcus sp.]|jgi:uncharacterized protein RhaS with RHS repeats|nr:hypothetical protein [Azoarcus sp.]
MAAGCYAASGQLVGMYSASGQLIGIFSDSQARCAEVRMPVADYRAVLASGAGAGGDAGEIDYSSGGAVFGFFFSVTVGLWFLAKCAGVVLQAIRRF